VAEPLGPPDLAYRCRAHGSLGLEYIGQGIERLAGVAPAELVSGRIGWADLLHPGDLERRRAALDLAARDSAPFELEYRLRTKAGGERPVRELGLPVLGEGGEPLAFEGYLWALPDPPETGPETAPAAPDPGLRTLLDHLPAAIQGYDCDGTVFYWNRASERVYGWSAEEALGRNLGDLIVPPEVAPHFRRALDESRHLTRSGEFLPAGELELQRKGGGRVAVYSTHTALCPSGGSPLLYCLDIDLTERRRAELERQRYVSLAEQSSEFIGMCDMAFMPFFVNDAGLRLVGLDSLEQALKTPVAEFFFPEDQAFVLEEYFPLVLAAGRGEVEIRFRHFKTGEPLWMIYTVFRLRDADGSPLGLATVSRDITDRKAAERRLNETRRDLERAQAIGHIGSWRLDVSRNVLDWSAESYRIFGLPLGSPLTYESFLSAVHPHDRAYVGRMWQAALQGEPYDIEHRVIADGRVKWVREVAELERGPDGSVRGGFGISQDITERKAAERDQEKLLRMIEASGDFIGTADLDGRLTYLNSGARRLLGLGPDDDPGDLHFTDYVPEEWQQFFQDRVVRTALEEGYWEGEMQLRNLRTGAPIDVHRHTILIWDPLTGEPWCFATAARDVTEQKRAERALREADRRKDEFLATLAHELRNPLAPIRNSVQILKLVGAPDPAAQSALAMIERQLQHTVRLVDDLLDVSRITRGKLQLRRERVDLAALLGQSLEISRPQAERAGHRLEVALPPGPIHLDADPVRLIQVFLNLINNACKYTEKGGLIRISVERAGDWATVRVTDSGIGIAPEHLGQIFEMFSQLGERAERAQGGLGIGLSLARGLVEMHGGSIEAQSAGLGRGSSFAVRLPVEIEAPEPDGAGAPEQACAPGGCPRVLVADDNADVADSLAMLLGLHGCAVEVARDGLEAVAAAERFRPDLVLLDIGMPGQDGNAACRQIRAAPWGRAMTLYALTGWGQDDDRRRSEEAGFDGHLVKPVEPEVLLRLLGDRRGGQG
jgi:PAS domain S-box-containing protein